MVGDKGVNELISAYSLFKQKYSNTILLLVGKFEEQRDPLKKVTLDIIKDNDDILHVGYKKDVRPYFAKKMFYYFQVIGKVFQMLFYKQVQWEYPL